MSGARAIPLATPRRRAEAAARARAADRMIQALSLGLLVITLLYVVFADAGEDPTKAIDPERISPLNRWVWLGLLALAAPVVMARWRQMLALARGNWPLALLMGYFALSVLWALDPSASLRRVFLTYLQLVLVAALVCGIHRAPLLHGAIALACAIAALVDLAALLLAPGFTLAEDGFIGLQGQKNQAGLLLMYCGLACIPCLALLTRRTARILLAGAIGLIILLLLLTRSRTSQAVVLAAAIVVPLLRVIARWRPRIVWAVVGCLIGLPMAALLLYLAWCGVAAADPLGPLRGATFSARTDIWSFMFDEIARRPWFGAGYESFWGIDAAIQPSLKTDQWFSLYAPITEGHDGYLDLLATGGVVALALGLLVLGRSIAIAVAALNRAQPTPLAWRSGRLARPTAAFHLAFLLGLAVHNVTESNFFSNNGILAVAFLICMLDLEKWRLAEAAR